MAIPTKRHQHEGICYLDLAEIKALLRAPDRSRWLGRRDHALLLTLIQTGLRVSELTALRVRDITLDTAAHVRVTGKGRKRRTVTLTRETAAVLHQWLTERQGQPDDPCSQPVKAHRSPATPSGCSSPSTHRIQQLPVAQRQARHSARAAPHQRDAAQS
jgi:integrase/recombinase XerD